VVRPDLPLADGQQEGEPLDPRDSQQVPECVPLALDHPVAGKLLKGTGRAAVTFVPSPDARIVAGAPNEHP